MPNERTSRSSPPTRRPVLIVEDEVDLREMMAQLLELEGVSSATAANGREALAYLRDGNRPDVILLDLMMPVMDGWEFLRHQRADAHLAQVPVIVLSALDRSHVGDVPAAEYLGKPLDFARLLNLIRGYCG
jgi:CheY-like chemotaxis protein